MKRFLIAPSNKDVDDTDDYVESIFLKIEGDELSKHADRYLLFHFPQYEFVLNSSLTVLVHQISTIMWNQPLRFTSMNPMKFTMILPCLSLRFP
jgi:hypothetical protein